VVQVQTPSRIPVSRHREREDVFFLLFWIRFAAFFEKKPNRGDDTYEEKETSNRAACNGGDGTR